MNVSSKSSNQYGIYKNGNKHVIVKNLKEYDNKEDAIKDLLKLVNGILKESDLK